MSRNIKPRTSLTLTEEEAALHRAEGEKLIFTSYRGRKCALHLQEGRLVEASFFPEEPGKMGAVYVGRVKNLAKNIDACFVEIAKGETCFLSMRNAVSPCLLNRRFDGRLLVGDELPVQVVRDAQKTKQAAVTAQISLADDYIAMALGPVRTGYSTKLHREKKEAIKKFFHQAGILENDCLVQELVKEKAGQEGEGIPSVGIVVRTRAQEISEEELLGHFQAVLEQFAGLMHTAMHRCCFSCLREAEDGAEAVLEQFAGDSSPSEVSWEGDGPRSIQAITAEKAEKAEEEQVPPGEVITDQEEIYKQLSRYIREQELPVKIRFYQDSMLSLSALYGLEHRIEEALGSRVWLKSGGYLVIEHTEALTVIDVNSGKCEAEKTSQETYRGINLEAAAEIAVQLKLRNLSGIILVDFINMQSGKDNAELMQYLRTRVRQDRVKTTVVDMTPLGLVEITRKKTSKPLREQFLTEC